MTALPDIPLPAGDPLALRRRHQRPAMHVLEAGFETPGRPCVLLLHGFPELAFPGARSCRRWPRPAIT